MLKKIALASFMPLIACGSEIRTANIVSYNEFLANNVPAIVRPHFVEFFEYCDLSSESNSDLCHQNIKFLSFELKQETLLAEIPNAVGLCSVGDGRKIYLRSDLFLSDSLTFKALVWHELGHCLLNLDHVPSGKKSSLMNAILPSESQMAKNWSYFVSNFFKDESKVADPAFTLHGRNK